MKKYLPALLISMLIFMAGSFYNLVFAQATVPLNITVNGALVITDASNDSMSGTNPNINVNLSVTPDLSVSTVTGQANFRVRTNKTTWRLTAQRTASNAGTTGIADTDVTVAVTKSAGTTGNANAGTILSPFTSTNISQIPTASSIDVVNGTAKTSSAKDSGNTNNYFQVNTTYGISPDFFFAAGTYSTTITYNLVSP